LPSITVSTDLPSAFHQRAKSLVVNNTKVEIPGTVLLAASLGVCRDNASLPEGVASLWLDADEEMSATTGNVAADLMG
jgi:hypothetical protein